MYENEENRADKRIKVTSEEVLDTLSNNDYMTVMDLAQEYDCSPQTIRRKLRELRKSGEPIIHSFSGLSLINKIDLEEVEKAQELESFINWTLSTFKSMIRCASPTKKFLPQMRRTLQIELSKEERTELMKTCARVTALLAFMEAQDEMM